jgi:hypothetical protein
MSVNAEMNRLNVIKRAKTQIRRKVMHNNLNFMISLTTKENIQDRKKFGKMVSEFERRVKLKLKHKREWDALTIFELQKRGANHAHMAVHGWQPLEMLRKEWLAITGGKGTGRINITYPRDKRTGKYKESGTWDTVSLSQYLCKYINKAICEDHFIDKKTYWHTRGIDAPPVTSILVEIGTEEYWANYIVQFVAGRKKHTWTDYNGAIGRAANF